VLCVITAHKNDITQVASKNGTASQAPLGAANH
jgi:hypothetical protein